jgi:DNA repair protein RadC
MSIKDWPVSERPRKKLPAKGAHYFSDAETPAVLVGGSGWGWCDALGARPSR